MLIRLKFCFSRPWSDETARAGPPAERNVAPVVRPQKSSTARPDVGRLSASALRPAAFAAAGPAPAPVHACPGLCPTSIRRFGVAGGCFAYGLQELVTGRRRRVQATSSTLRRPGARSFIASQAISQVWCPRTGGRNQHPDRENGGLLADPNGRFLPRQPGHALSNRRS